MDDLLRIPLVAVLFMTLTGFVLAILQVLMFAVTVRYKILQELKENSPAIGWVVAGLLISNGIILYSAMSNHAWYWATVGWTLLGSALNVLGYHLVNWLTPGWDLSRAIDEHHLPGAVICFGVFITIGLIVAGAIS